MFEIGRLCMKIAGRDAGNKCVIIDIIDNNFVMIDGNVRRKKCNIRHLEPLKEVIKIKKGASHDDVASEFKKLKLDVWNTKPKESKEKPKKQRMQRRKAFKAKKAEEKPKKAKKKSAKKADKKKTKKAKKASAETKTENKE